LYKVGCTRLCFKVDEFLLKLLNTYASNSLEYFIRNLDKAHIKKLFLDVLKHPSSYALRERISRENLMLLRKIISDTSDTQIGQIMKQKQKYTYVLALKILAKKIPRWLHKNVTLRDKMLPVIKKLKESRLQREEMQRKGANSMSGLKDMVLEPDIKEVIQVMKILIRYCKQNKSEISVLFEMLEIFNQRIAFDLTFVTDFYQEYIHKSYSSR